MWHHFYEFWVGQQTLPGNILGDVLIGIATFFIGKYKVAPWLHARHKEHLEQRDRQHHELLAAHRELIELHRSTQAQVLEKLDRINETAGRAQPAQPAQQQVRSGPSAQ